MAALIAKRISSGLILACLALSLGACSTHLTSASSLASPAPTTIVSTATAALAATHTASAAPATATPTPSPTLTPTPSPSLTPTPTPTDTPTPTPTPTPWPTPDGEAINRRVRLPILMYHYVEPWPPEASAVRKNLTVRPDDFAAQMAYLHDQGYVAVSLYDLLYALTLDWPLPQKAVVLTFDDGYRTLMQHAVPMMRAYGYTGTVFVITELMDREFEQYLTWEQAEGLYAQGWKIEPHTKTHASLQGRDRDFQLYQMLGSVQTVEAHIGARPRFFNYPAGRYDDLTLQLAHEMGLWGGVSVRGGRVHTLDTIYTLARVRVSGQGTLQDFIHGLEGDLRP
jgi:peptidoglycan/xylan/chitin deacetylase (PgdA/CDA1 family)